MVDTISEDEFHRMQMQMIELRTENYQLKDENKKMKISSIQSQQNVLQLEREINKQTKLKKAIGTFGKSRQTQEFEELLQQNEQAFIMQNQTLMEELNKLQSAITKLENEKKLLVQGANYSAPDKEKDGEIRNLKATNNALQKSLNALKETHAEEVRTLKESISGDCEQSDTKIEQNSGDVLQVANEDPLTHDSSESSNVNSIESNLVLNLQEQAKKYSELELRLSTAVEEKTLLEKDIDAIVNEHKLEVIKLQDDLVNLQDKYEQKQQSYSQLQSEMTELQTYKSETSKLVIKYQEDLEERNNSLEQMKLEIPSLQQALKDAHEKVQKQQQAITGLENQLKNNVDNSKSQSSQYQESLSKIEIMNKEVNKLKDLLKNASKEKEEALALFQKSTHASTALITQQDNLEKECDRLRGEVQNALNLAEKRKNLADQQAIKTQEITVEMNAKMQDIHKETDVKLHKLEEGFKNQLENVKDDNKRQEEELIRLRQLDRSRTRELDGFQQQINDLTASKTSLENSKGWFERALKDAEKLAETTEERHRAEIDHFFQDKDEEIKQFKQIIEQKDQEIENVSNQQVKITELTAEYESKIEGLKQEINDEVHKQKIVEKKVHSTLKDLKKQLTAERKKSEAIQEKLQQNSSGNVDELLSVVNNTSTKSVGADGSSVSSFSFKDFITPKNTDKSSPSSSTLRARTSSPVSSNNQLTLTESSDLLDRITELQNEKWALEEKVKHLEESAGAMADELVDKSHVIQEYVNHTRTDFVKKNNNDPPHQQSSLRSKVKSFVTGIDENSMGAGIGNINELNKKLTRMLEEEMTKNLALKQDMEIMAQELSRLHMEQC